MTLMEVLVAATLLVVLTTLVSITMGVVTNVSETVNTQYQEFDQAIPALAPLQSLIRAEVEPGPAGASGGPTAGFASIGSFAVTFYSNIGTAYNNYTSQGTTAGPAKIVAEEIAQNGLPVTSSTTCSVQTPCSFQVRRYLPVVNNGVPTCPVVNPSTGQPYSTSCQYPSTYTLITNTNDVINNPSSTATINGVSGTPTQPVFSYSFFDPCWPGACGGSGTTILVTASMLTTSPQALTGLSGSGSPGYPVSTQQISACAATSTNYPTTAIACPLDAIQSVAVDLMIATAGSGTGTSGQVENQTVVYRYQPSGPGGTLYPYQYTSAVG